MEVTNAPQQVNDESITQSLWVCTTRTCNFDCGYCYQGSHATVPKDLKRFMPDEVLQRALPWALRWTTRGLNLIWYGGEPLLSWPLIEKWIPIYATAFAHLGKTIRFSCTTNGSLLTPAARDLFDKYKVGVLLSLDGPQKLHDQSRTFYDESSPGVRRGTWSSIPLKEILAWRACGPPRDPKEPWRVIEVAWQLSPGIKVTPADLDEFMALGFTNVNFNLQWLEEWPPAARIWLEEFFRAVGRKAIRGELATNWRGKLEQALTVDQKMLQPCGTGLAMLGLSPEGWLYPSQEMVYTSVLPDRAPGTAEYYRVGNVYADPIIDMEVLLRVSKIRTEEMRPPAPFDCNNCIAKSASIGGCHCRYIGQDGLDASNRFDVKPGYCQSMVSAITGLVQAAAIERWIRPVGFRGAAGSSPCAGHNHPSPATAKARPLEPRAQTAPVDLASIAAQLNELRGAVHSIDEKLEGLDLVQIETEG